jgi:glycosyltransferase involved in cell wall biosynthesis
MRRSSAGRESDARTRYPLAVFARQIGLPSETFIRRHVQDLEPGGTAVVAVTDRRAEGGHWSVDGPALVLSSLGGRGLGGALGRLAGAPRDRTSGVRDFLREHGVRVAMGEYLDLSLPWLETANRLGIRFFGHAHGYDVSQALRDPKWREAYLRYREAAGVIAVSRHSRARLVELGLAPEKVHVVPCGVDVPPEPLARPERETVRCLAVGRMVGKKGPILTLDAFRRALEARPELRLDYVGGGELLPAAEQFVQAFDLAGRVTLHGSQPPETVLRLLQEADLFLQHSRTDPETGDEEGLPVAVLEAMAHALPVVATRHAGIPEAVAEGVSGYLVPEGDSTAMGERLAALARDPDLRRQMGRAGWERAREQFSWERERTDLRRILGLDEIR